VRFLLDESAEHRLADLLTDLGHDVTTVARDYPRSLTDEAVLAIAVEEDRIVITNDSDFGTLVFRDAKRHRGVVLFRMTAGNTARKVDALRRLVMRRAHDLDHFVVIDHRGVRVRREAR
jgi:predicted nuclease of predicted toxin-antitoxin system